jgi:hypothetical protein
MSPHFGTTPAGMYGADLKKALKLAADQRMAESLERRAAATQRFSANNLQKQTQWAESLHASFALC